MTTGYIFRLPNNKGFTHDQGTFLRKTKKRFRLKSVARIPPTRCPCRSMAWDDIKIKYYTEFIIGEYGICVFNVQYDTVTCYSFLSQVHPSKLDFI